MGDPDQNPEFEELISYIKTHRGFDFTGYKRSSLMRRINKRMQALKIETYSEYINLLKVAPQEFLYLFETVLINVTSFYRDSNTWEYIQTEIIPRIVARKSPGESIRIWSAGCASGQEAYTIATILIEVLGVKQFREQVKIYATDVDLEALSQARLAIYEAKEISSLPPTILERYFEQNNNYYKFRKDLRRSLIFGRHDLVQDPPISRIDLVTCRNTLMYFNTETQAKIIERLHFALNDGGFLCLGKAEMLLNRSDSFTTVDLKTRIFVKKSQTKISERLAAVTSKDRNEQTNYFSRLRDAAFEASPLVQLVIDAKGSLVLINQNARSLFNLSASDIGRPLQDLELSYRPVELRSSIDRVYASRRSTNIPDVSWTNTAGETYSFDVQIEPFFNFREEIIGINIIFTNVSPYKRLQEDLAQSHQELEMAYEELQCTNEELETTNEELQSSNEELETTNEELQSTNEELETMNEELQSSNEELQTMNEVLRLRSDDLNQANALLESIFISLGKGVVGIDRNLQVQIWNSQAEDLWGLRSEEAQGQHFMSLDIGLPVEQLRQPLRNCLAGQKDEPIVMTAIDRRGKTIQCQISYHPLLDTEREIRGVILFMERLDNNEPPAR